jgi:hypothetical protein
LKLNLQKVVLTGATRIELALTDVDRILKAVQVLLGELERRLYYLNNAKFIRAK